MKIFLLVLSLVFIFSAFYAFYCINKKQYKNILNTPFYVLTQYPKCTQCIAYILLIIALLMLIQVYGFSIAFISLWIFITPIIFLIILLKNNLKPK